jgi:hypothetical protein
MAPKKPVQAPRTSKAHSAWSLSHLTEIAKALGPDAFVLGIVPLGALYLVLRGHDPTTCFGFVLAVALVYAGVVRMRLRHSERQQEADNKAKYSSGERRLRDATNRSRGGQLQRDEPQTGT